MLFDTSLLPSRRAFVRAALGRGSAAAMVALSGCSLMGQPVHLAAHVWSGYEPMFLAQNRRWLDSERVQLVQTRDSDETLAALKEGRADAGALTLDEVLSAPAESLRLGGLVRQDLLLSHGALDQQLAAWRAHQLDAIYLPTEGLLK
jgi:hypothetical protein